MTSQQLARALADFADRLRWRADELRSLADGAPADELARWARTRPFASLLTQADGLAVAAAEVQAAVPVEEAPVEWTELRPLAMRTIKATMAEGEGRDALAAAKAVVDRVEGRVPQRVEVSRESDGPLLDSPFWRFVLSLAMHAGITWAEAEARAHADPEGVAAWARERGLVGREVVGTQQLGTGAPPPGVAG